jgi:hypothetical protein
MRNKYAQQGSYINGCPTGPDTGWLAMVMDDVAAKEINHSAFMSWQRPMLAPRFMKMYRTVFVGQLPDGSIVVVGDNGHCLTITPSGQAIDEFVSNGTDSPKNTGHLRSAAVVGNQVMAVGMQRQVYLRSESGQWSEARAGLPPLGQGETSGFEAVVAVQPGEVYAAGWDGEIWRFDGRRWHPVDSPTNRIITALCVDPASGTVFGCGRTGLLLSGRGDAWQTLPELRCPDDLWSLAVHGKRLFAASLKRLYLIEDDAISLVDLGEIGAESFGVLSQNQGQLWSIGEKDVVAYDGSAWSRVA